ncbi:MAG: UDP-3-O-(3-hydroxymyristoyl)glucosamine N-acyltransferase [Bacteroidia bacterium]|nr:UDP-3-O-(3-hydroxymyristoyl)glucosamine N-acyltransferase [Bacteroidia bacterium]
MVTLQAIQDKYKNYTVLGELNTPIVKIVQLNIALQPNEMAWCADKNKEQLLQLSAGTVIVSNEVYLWFIDVKKEFNNLNFIIVDAARRAFLKIVQTFFTVTKPVGSVAASAYIHPSVIINTSKCNIGHNVVIEANCTIGNNVEIGNNTVILEGTIINDNVKIGCNNTIGGVGFGYEKDENGNYELIPHIGNVIIGAGAEIGSNNCIDRAVLGSTLIEKNVKIDNLVHIAHGVILRENCLIIANAMIGGSTEIGKNTWVAPSTSIMQKLKIGNDALIGMAAVVLKDVEDRSVMVGSPAKKIKTL